MEWLAKDRIDPPVDHYLIAGVLASTIATVMGNGKKSYQPEDFFPHLARSTASAPKRKQTVQEMRAIFGGFASRHTKE